MVLATIGSLGDLHPFMALGLALRELGAEVVVAASAEYRSKVERAGLEFRAVRPSFEDMERTLGMSRAELTEAVLARGDFLFRRLIVPHVRRSYEDMLPLIEGADIAVTSSLAFGARLAAERSSTPWIGAVLQPLLFLSAYDPPMVPQVPGLSALLRRLGPVPSRWALRLLSGALAPLLRPVHELRREIGLPRSRINPLFDGQFGPAGAIGLYSGVLGGVRADYPRPASIAGFAWYDSVDGVEAALPPGLGEFLDAGPRPLVFTLGSLVVHSPGNFFRESVAAARALGRRAVLLVGEAGLEACAQYRSCGCSTADLGSAERGPADHRPADHRPAERGPGVFVCAYAPHSLLFPRAAAIVHQGGIGTLGQALRAARPQLIVPYFADQADNADRAVRLRTARSLTPRRYRAAAAARELAALLSNDAYGLEAARIAAQIGRESGAVEAARFVLNRIESPLPKHGELP